MRDPVRILEYPHGIIVIILPDSVHLSSRILCRNHFVFHFVSRRLPAPWPIGYWLRILRAMVRYPVGRRYGILWGDDRFPIGYLRRLLCATLWVFEFKSMGVRR
jgi:hypothetical protein